MEPDYYAVDSQFGPPSVGSSGMGGSVTHRCRTCDVWWADPAVIKSSCWMCGGPGVVEHRYFHGAVSRFVDDPPAWYVADEERRRARIAKAREEAA